MSAVLLVFAIFCLIVLMKAVKIVPPAEQKK